MENKVSSSNILVSTLIPIFWVESSRQADRQGFRATIQLSNHDRSSPLSHSSAFLQVA
jgi:hypothetical protein